MQDHESLILALHSLGAVQFGQFTLKSGETSPIYLDLRLLVSQPGTLRRVAHTLQPIASHLTFDRLAAIPMAGLPIGVALSLAMDRPLIYPRPQVKGHGTGREIEGQFNAGETALLVDDVLSRGGSKLEAAQMLASSGLKVTDMLVLIDRDMGGAEELASQGYRVHSALSLREILETLARLGRITLAQQLAVQGWLDAQRS